MATKKKIKKKTPKKKAPKRAPMPLNSDDLGAVGEGAFPGICAVGTLLCNPSDNRDRTGWDFIVEDRFLDPAEGSLPLETRGKPLSCHVQVKTIWEHNDRVALRLTSVEHLAKEIKPAFIYVLKVNKAKVITGAHLIHLMDKPLAKVLKRLREEDIAKTKKPNHEFVYMQASKEGVALAPTGDALRIALEAACGNDVRAYADRKTAQLKTLGFENGAFQVKAKFEAGKYEDFVNAFLGIGSLKAKSLKTSEVRFGLKKPLKDAQGDAIVTIQPTPTDSCTITLRTAPLSLPAVFRAEVFVPAIPNLPAEYQRLLLKADLFTMMLARGNWTINFGGGDQPHTPSKWADYWHFSYAMKSGSGTIQIVADKTPINSTIAIDQKAEGGYEAEVCKWHQELCEGAAEVLKRAGVTQEPVLTMAAMSEAQKKVMQVHQLLHPEIGKMPLKFQTMGGDAMTTETVNTDMIFIDWVFVGDALVAYCTKAALLGVRQANEIGWSSENADLVAITNFTDPVPDLEKFIAAMEKQTGISNKHVRTFQLAPDPLEQESDAGSEAGEVSQLP